MWNACVNIGWPFGPLLQLLILTGQRRNEVGGMTWPELDMTLKLWQLPKGRVKNDKGIPYRCQSLPSTSSRLCRGS